MIEEQCTENEQSTAGVQIGGMRLPFTGFRKGIRNTALAFHAKYCGSHFRSSVGIVVRVFKKLRKNGRNN